MSEQKPGRASGPRAPGPVPFSEAVSEVLRTTEAQRRRAEAESRGVGLALNDLSYGVIGAAIEVHRELGPGFLESVYEEALAIEFGLRGLPFERQAAVVLNYKGWRVSDGRVDFIVAGRLIVELKAVRATLDVHAAQVLSYLKAAGLPLGLLINFNVPALRDGIRRLILT